MSKQTIHAKDLIPLTICVLHKLGFHCIVFTIKFIVENVYPDLKGMVRTDAFDHSSLELLDLFDMEVKQMTYRTVHAIEETFVSLANVYGLDVRDVIQDERLDDMSDDFYWATVIDGFPRDDDEEDEGKLASESNFDLYVLSMLNSINGLCHLLRDHAFDFSNGWGDDELFYTYFLSQDYTKEEHSLALKLVQDLGIILQDYQMDALDMTAKYSKKKRG